jgi:hypothetical protein
MALNGDSAPRMGEMYDYTRKVAWSLIRRKELHLQQEPFKPQ